MIRKLAAGLGALACLLANAAPAAAMEPGALDAMIARHAAAHSLPADLVRRVVMRESRGNPRAVNAGNYGIMQIRHGTARAMGYSGSAEGLLDPETNMTYAVKYLAGAYRAAGGNADGAMSNYQRGYYHAAKRQGFSPYAARGGLAAGAGLFAHPAAAPAFVALCRRARPCSRRRLFRSSRSRARESRAALCAANRPAPRKSATAI